MKSPMNMAPNKMKTPMKMAPNKMKSPMEMAPTKMAPTKFNEKLRAAKAAGDLPPEFAAVVKMKSPMKMGSAYKLDKSGFKLKSAPVNMKTPGSIAKLAGVSPAKLDLTKAKNVAGDLVEGLKGFAQGSKRSISAGIRGAKSRYNRSKSSRTGEEVGLAGESKTAKEEGRS